MIEGKEMIHTANIYGLSMVFDIQTKDLRD